MFGQFEAVMNALSLSFSPFAPTPAQEPAQNDDLTDDLNDGLNDGVLEGAMEVLTEVSLKNSLGLSGPSFFSSEPEPAPEPAQIEEQAAELVDGPSEQGSTQDDVLATVNDANDDATPPPPNVFQRVTIEREPEHPTDSIRQILRELKEMNCMNFDDEQVRVTMKEDNPRHLLVTLAPVDGLYVDGLYEVSMTLGENYPHERPDFHFNTPIFHPNINYEGKICFSLLDEDSSSLRIADYAHGLLWLLYYPNLYSRLNMDCSRDEKEFAQMVRKSIVGGVVAGKTYERSARLPKKENEKEAATTTTTTTTTEVVVRCENLQNEKNGKKWEWRLVNEDWVQVFV